MNVLVTAFTYRCFSNWEPVLNRLVEQGHAVATAVFPRISDPDHLQLLAVPFENRFTCKIGIDFQPIDCGLDNILSVLRSQNVDVILMCSPHAGPEREIKGGMADMPRRPLIVGLQHGVHQDWAQFEAEQERFDRFGVFGIFFLQGRSPELLRKMFVAGLPKLDKISYRPATGTVKRILFATQDAGNEHPAIAGIESTLGVPVVLRQHPEYRSGQEAPLQRVMHLFDAMVTTGSTIALEGLASGARVAVLPEHNGEVYQDAGIVADSSAASDIIRVIRKYDDQKFRTQVLEFLESVSGGMFGLRTELALSAINTLHGDSEMAIKKRQK